MISWSRGQAVAAEPVRRCTDSALDALIPAADVIGIDAPFGWPLDFVNAVDAWPFEEWNGEIRDRLRLRSTDRFVHGIAGLTPLSVSSDRIALPAMRAMALLKRHGVTDRSGDGRFYEVYPAGSLAAWNLPSRGYKKQSEGLTARERIRAGLLEQLPWLEVPDAYADNADDLDALVASLTARAAFQGLTHLPPRADKGIAIQEGWIHIPTDRPSP
jgi:hypothetical protein